MSEGKNRDEQFQGFAKAVMEELLTHFGDFEDMERIIAHRAQDLVKYTIDNAREYCLEDICTEDIISLLPDMADFSEDDNGN